MSAVNESRCVLRPKPDRRATARTLEHSHDRSSERITGEELQSRVSPGPIDTKVPSRD